jgi:hypothetical protein
VDLGTAVFLPVSEKLATSDVSLTSLILDIGNQSIAPCVSEDEDQHWSVKVLVTDGVTPTENSKQVNSLSVYPNPAGDELFVQNSNSDPVTITFYDVIGRSILSASVAEESTTTIDIEPLSLGSYVMVCHIGDVTTIRRISKVK